MWGESIAKDSGWTTNIVKALAKAFKIDLDKPWNKLGDKQREILMHGTGDSACRCSGRAGTRPASGRCASRASSRSSSAAIARDHRPQRAHYEQFFRAVPCAVCDGTRLRPESRAVIVETPNGKHRLSTARTMTAREAYEFITAMKLAGSRLPIAGEVFKEIKARLQFLLDVGLDYLRASLRRHAQRRRSAAHPAGVAAGSE